jgi:hypothetical protein
MAIPENRDRDSLNQEDSIPTEEYEKFTPGQQQPDSKSEPRQGQGNRPVQEYPGEGVTVHFPSGPSTGEKKPSQGTGSSDEDSDNQGAE